MKTLFLFLFFATLGVAMHAQTVASQDTAKYAFGSTTYPGCLSGEIFLGNIFPDRKSYPQIHVAWSGNNPDLRSPQGYVDSYGREYNEIGWTTKRLGDKAYGPKGNLLSDARPVFVKKAELVSAGILKE